MTTGAYVAVPFHEYARPRMPPPGAQKWAVAERAPPAATLSQLYLAGHLPLEELIDTVRPLIEAGPTR
ncbi:hypothetical protein ACX80H_08755 [Arthrobacter sp. MDT2-2]